MNNQANFEVRRKFQHFDYDMIYAKEPTNHKSPTFLTHIISATGGVVLPESFKYSKMPSLLKSLLMSSGMPSPSESKEISEKIDCC